MCLNHLHDLVISLLTQRSDSQNEERTFHFEKKKKKRNESPNIVRKHDAKSVFME